MNEIIKTSVKVYRYDLSKDEERVQYDKLVQLLKSKNIKKSASLTTRSFTEKELFYSVLDSVKTVELETKHIFQNQWNTTPFSDKEIGYRHFDWHEEIYPNQRIKHGYYLDLPEEAITLRKEIYKCGYCGTSHRLPKQEYCDKCLGSQYLEESELYLLRLKPIIGGEEEGSKEVPSSLKKSYHEEQFKARKKRLEDRTIRKECRSC